MGSSRSSMDCQDGLLSLKDFLMSNQNSLFLLQKHIIQNAVKNVEEEKISAAKIGPMGILRETFGED